MVEEILDTPFYSVQRSPICGAVPGSSRPGIPVRRGSPESSEPWENGDPPARAFERDRSRYAMLLLLRNANRHLCNLHRNVIVSGSIKIVDGVEDRFISARDGRQMDHYFYQLSRKS